MFIKKDGAVPYYTAAPLENMHDVIYAVSTRFGGCSAGNARQWLNLGFRTGDDPQAVRENYRRFCEATALPYENLVLAHQTHSLTVRRVTAADAGKGVVRERDYTDVDALITNESNIPLVIHTADCVPVTLIDPQNHAVGNAHCGWRGTLGCLATKTLEAMHAAYGTEAKNVTAIIGPCIQKCCYAVSEDLYQTFLEKFNTPHLIFARENRFYLDLAGINRHILERAGVTVYGADICTCCNKQEFYSHRGLGTERGVFGTFVCLR